MKKILGILIIVLSLLPLIGCAPAQSERCKYVINAVYDDENKTVSASMTFNFINNTQSELEELPFHLYGNAYREGAKYAPISASDISTAYPEGINYGGMEVLSVKVDGNQIPVTIIGEDEDILSVPLDGILPTQETTVEIDFKVKLANVKHRLGYCDGYINLGNWYPVLCSRRNGEWDTHPYYSNGDPFNSDIADYTVSLKYPENYAVAYSGEGIADRGNLSASLSNARDFAIVLGAFNETKMTVQGKNIKYYSLRADEREFLSTASDAVETFSDLFGEYAYQSLSVVETPFLNGGMEYPGLVYVSLGLNDAMSKEVIIHEIAHQWWYAAVGNDQVREAWIDEGLSEYSTTLFYENNEEYNVKRQDRIADSLTTYTLYCELYNLNGKDTAMSRCLNDFSTQMEYTYMTYIKGQLLFDAIRNLIGDDDFYKGLRRYYKENKFKSASVSQLIGAFEEEANRPLSSFFSSWINGNVLMYNV